MSTANNVGLVTEKWKYSWRPKSDRICYRFYSTSFLAFSISALAQYSTNSVAQMETPAGRANCVPSGVPWLGAHKLWVRFLLLWPGLHDLTTARSPPGMLWQNATRMSSISSRRAGVSSPLFNVSITKFLVLHVERWYIPNRCCGSFVPPLVNSLGKPLTETSSAVLPMLLMLQLQALTGKPRDLVRQVRAKVRQLPSNFINTSVSDCFC